LEFYEPKRFRTQHKSNRQASNVDDLIDPSIRKNSSNFSYGGVVHIPDYPASQAIREHHKKSLQLFDDLIEAGVCREQARGVLPQNLYTTYYATCNLNNLLKFIDLRTHEGAQWEIQQLAKGMLEITQMLYPITVEAWKENTV
jgi:thymidylate synthase (FAD)